MKKYVYLNSAIITLIACLFFISCANKNPKPALPDNSFKNEEKEEGPARQDNMQEAIKFEIERTKDLRLGYVPKQRLLKAFNEVSRMSNSQRVQGSIPGITWNERGPGNVGGRTRSILVDKNDPTGNTVWAGSVGGGLWKATNFTTAGYSWTAVNNLFPNLAVSAIAQNPTNTNVLYFGTGEGFYNADALQGGGMWKSTDGGVTWNQLTATNVTSPTSIFAFIQKIVVKQVAGTEYLLVATRKGGVQRSTDGGATFTQVLTSVSSMDAAADIEVSFSGDIYASLGLGLGTDGIYKSIDNGTTWTKQLVGLPPSGYSRIELACAPGDNNVVYASFQNAATNDCLGIYKTTNAGVAWLPVTNPNDVDGTNWTSTQAWYGMIIAVDPDNANHVVIGGLDAYVTADGGTTWAKLSSWYGGAPQFIHADHHAIQFFKTATAQKYLYFGNDGGMFFSANASVALPSAVQKNSGYNVTQFYHGAMGPVPSSNIYLAGAQDNGTQYFTAPGINNTTAVTGGDGAFCHIDDDNPNIQISQYVYNYYWITNNNWASYATVQIGSSVGSFINPTDYDSRTNSLYGAYSSGSYSLIKNVGTTNDASTKAISGLGAVKAVRVSPNTISRVFFGNSSGKITRVDNADGASPTFTNITTTIPVAGTISEIAVQEGDDNHIIYCVSNYGVISIWETNNGGTSWHSIEGNFTQDVPVRAIIFSPNSNTQAFIGTDIGVYSTDMINGASTNWGETNNGLARVSVQHLEYRKGQGTLLAVTHGRGVYTSTSLEGPVINFGGAFGVNDQQLTETPTTTTGCRKYTDITIPITLSSNPSAAAQVNVSVNTALSTATAGQDFELLTAMPLSFSTASTQNIAVRIYDDAVVEGTEKAVLEISVTNPGATNVKKGAGYLDFITILDNDKAPEAAGANVVVFSENWESGMGTWSGFGTGTTTAPNAWKLSNTCGNIITNQTAVIYNQPANTCGYDNTKISAATIYQTINATGKSNLSLEFDWKGYGEIGYDEGQAVYDTSGLPSPTWIPIAGATGLSGNSAVLHRAVTLPSQLNNRSFKLGFQWNNDNNTGTDPAFAVDNIQVLSTLPAPVQTAIDPTTVPTNYVGPNETVHFYDNSGNVIASLKNNNGAMLGCVKIEIDRAGANANVPFWYNIPSTYLASKTYKVTAPDAPASGVSYDITVYYTNAEITRWKSESSHIESDARIVKVTGHTISEVTPTTPYTSSVTISPAPTMATYNFTDYSFTTTFTSFSGFGLGVPGLAPLPVTLLNFTGVLDKDKAILNWATAMEFQNKGFYLEKSFDGINFYPITFVDGYGTSIFSHSYSYNDYDLTKSVMYYRLKQVNLDGNFAYSNIVKLHWTKDVPVRVYPNPFHNTIQILFGEAVKKAHVELFNANGSKVYSNDLQLNGQSSVNINLNKALAKGDYILMMNYNNKKKQIKLLKQ